MITPKLQLKRLTARSLRHLLPVLGVLLLLLGLVPAASAAPGGEDAKASAKVEPGLLAEAASRPQREFNVIVTREAPRNRTQVREDADEVEREVKATGGKVTRRFSLIAGQAVTLKGKEILKLARHKRVKSVAADRKVKLLQTVPVPAPLLSTQTATANAPAVWSQYGNKGGGVTVAVLDSGVPASAELPTAVFGVDVTQTAWTALQDRGGHGAHVAGIIAGNGALSAGAYQGIAPAARVLSVKVTTDDGLASYSNLIAGLQWVVSNTRQHNIRVVNLSIGAVVASSYVDDPVVAAAEAAWFRGVVVVASAGNEGPGPSTIAVPGNSPYVVTVGAYDDNQTNGYGDDALPDWTSRGPTAVDGFAKPDLVASGRRVVSLRAPGSHLDLLLPDRIMGLHHFRLSGTSMAAPVVSGTVALMLAARPGLSPNQVKYALKQTARSLPYGSTAVGAGAVNAQAAVQLALAGVNENKANRGQTPNKKMTSAIWPVLKSMSPKWRSPGYNGSVWVDGSWDKFKRQDGSWDDGSWDYVSAQNLDWEHLDWDTANWADGSWDDGSWADGSWDSSGWDNAGWDSADRYRPVP